MKSNRDVWTDYATKYGTYSSSVYRSRLVMLVAENVLKEYPKNLPPKIRERVLPTIGAFGRLLLGGHTAKGPSTIERAGFTKRETEIEDETHSILTATFGLMVFEAREAKRFDFSRALYSNEVVMQVAYLDAFVRDTLGVIRRLRPKATRSTERIGYFRERVNWFEQLGLDLKDAETQIEWLEEAEDVRDIIVHNGGRVDQQFLHRTGRRDLSIGQPFPLGSHYLLRVYRGSTGFSATLFTEAAEKFLGISPMASAVKFVQIERDVLRRLANLRPRD